MYAKIFTSLYQGTLRGNSHGILVFTNLLAHADAAGEVDIHPRAIAEEVGLQVDQVRAALLLLEAPDEESRSPDEEGRRIMRLDAHRAWGWRIVNHAKYRAIRNEDDRREQNRKAQAAFRERQKHATEAAKSKPRKPRSAHTEAEAEKYNPPQPSAAHPPQKPKEGKTHVRNEDDGGPVDGQSGNAPGRQAPHGSAPEVRDGGRGDADAGGRTDPADDHGPAVVPSAGPVVAADRAAKALTNLLLQDLVGEGLPPEVAAEFIAHRKRHKAPITPLAWKLIRHAAEKAGWPIDQAVAKMIARGWRGLEASWLMREQVDLQGLQQSASGETPKQRAARERAAEICPAVARAAPDGSPTLATSRFAPGPRAPFVQRPAQVAEDIPYTEKRSIVK